MRIAVPADSKNGLKSPVSQHFGRCPVFILLDVEEGRVTTVEEVDNPYYGRHEPGQVPAFIKEQGADVILVGGMGRRALAYFEQSGVKAVRGLGWTVEEALQGFIGGRLEDIEPCGKSMHHHNHDSEE